MRCRPGLGLLAYLILEVPTLDDQVWSEQHACRGPFNTAPCIPRLVVSTVRGYVQIPMQRLQPHQLALMITGLTRAVLLGARAFQLSTADPRRVRPELAAALAEERWGADSSKPNPALSRPHAAAERAARLARLAQPRTALWELCKRPPSSRKHSLLSMYTHHVPSERFWPDSVLLTS